MYEFKTAKFTEYDFITEVDNNPPVIKIKTTLLSQQTGEIRQKHHNTYLLRIILKNKLSSLLNFAWCV